VALREDQILRYSRQILLKAVGGRGQEALLEGGARLEGTGPAGLTAAAYLAGGGTPVVASGARLTAAAVGFLVSEEDVGLPAAEVLARVLPDVNPDAASPRAGGRIAELPAAWNGEAPWVALGGDGARGAVVFRGSQGCVWCFGETVRALGPPPSGVLGVALGALGALVFQRLQLGMGPELGGRWFTAPGQVSELEVRQCSRCREWPLPSDLSEIIRHLESTYPQEGCGVILRAGPSGPFRMQSLPNAYDRYHAADPARFPHTSRTAYFFEPREWLTLNLEAEARGERIACVFHSHVNGVAQLSAEDRAQALPDGQPILPGVSYLVVALVRGNATEARLFRWVDGEFRDRLVPLSV
jgi:proteasome lid subunit RPN8/RPN11